jgi:prefoldin subunit 5
MPQSAAAALLSRIKAIEAQIAALRQEVEKLVAEEEKPRPTFADLKGVWAGQGNFSEEEIDAALYQLPPGFEDDIATLPKGSE